MTIYVDELDFRGMKYRGNDVRSCHMMTDGDIQELHDMATKLGMRKWFQEHENHPHYDLMTGKRKEAVSLGAVEVSSIEMICKCDRRYREGWHVQFKKKVLAEGFVVVDLTELAE